MSSDSIDKSISTWDENGDITEGKYSKKNNIEIIPSDSIFAGTLQKL